MFNASSPYDYPDYPTSNENVIGTTNLSSGALFGEPGLRVMGGDNANPGEFPHQAYLAYSSGGSLSCSASIIHPLMLLTAAHCLFKSSSPQTLTVVTGEHNSSVNEGTEQWLTIRTAIMHENYNDTGLLENDIAILILQSPIKLDNFTKVINIPQPNQTLPAWAYASGWGRLGNTTTSPILQKARVGLVDMEPCRLAFQKKGYKMTNSDDLICAGVRAKDTCKGDSGGPLTCEDDKGEKYVCGIVSWGELCEDQIKYEQYIPGVYADVRKYHGWIQKHVQHWSEFYSEHFLPEPPRSSNDYEMGTVRPSKEGTRWEYLWS